MSEDMTGKFVNRRSFLRGSAVFAAAFGLSVMPALAQDQKKDEEPPVKKDPFANDGDTAGKDEGEKKLVDEEGREYRVCPQCAYNMYMEGRMWVCENCGYSYVE
jgi:rubredoxin